MADTSAAPILPIDGTPSQLNTLQHNDIGLNGSQHNGSQHLAINNTRLRRAVMLLALKTTARFFKHEAPQVRPISRRLLVKRDPFVHLTEAATMQFIASNTSIPVPRVYCSFVHRNQAFIVMERIDGEPLPKAWGKLSDDDRLGVYSQLRGMIQELRSLTPPPGMVGVQSCVGGSLYDSRIAHAKSRFGPFATIQEFHRWLREGLNPADHPEREADEDWLKVTHMAAKQEGPWPRPVFTHGDLNPFNIMIRGKQVVAIIDWEFSGWYPHYWEYTSAWYGSILRTAWQGDLEKFLEPHPEELEMEITRQQWWGEI